MSGNADKQFVCEYNHNGSTWALDLWADDEADAQRKLRSIGSNGRVVGSDPIRVKVPNWFGRLLVRIGLFKEAP